MFTDFSRFFAHELGLIFITPPETTGVLLNPEYCGKICSPSYAQVVNLVMTTAVAHNRQTTFPQLFLISRDFSATNVKFPDFSMFSR